MKTSVHTQCITVPITHHPLGCLVARLGPCPRRGWLAAAVDWQLGGPREKRGGPHSPRVPQAGRRWRELRRATRCEPGALGPWRRSLGGRPGRQAHQGAPLVRPDPQATRGLIIITERPLTTSDQLLVPTNDSSLTTGCQSGGIRWAVVSVSTWSRPFFFLSLVSFLLSVRRVSKYAVLVYTYWDGRAWAYQRLQERAVTRCAVSVVTGTQYL